MNDLPAEHRGEEVALRHLELLANELRRAGLATAIAPDRRPFPGVLVTTPAASVVIMAGRRCYWRKVRRDLVLVGMLSEPEFVARTVRTWLTDNRLARRPALKKGRR